MEPPNYEVLASLITPAIAVGVLAYFTRLFGRVVSDQKPFSDNRDWEIELSGVMFMISLTPGVLGIALASQGIYMASGWMHILNLLLVSFILTLALFANTALGQEFFRLNLVSEALHETSKEIYNFAYLLGKHVPLWAVAIPLFYAGAVEYLLGSIIWMILIVPLILYALISLASIYSMRNMMRRERVDVTVHFVNERRGPLTSAMILKVNEDNIRLRHENSVLIINKNEILKIEIPVPANHLPDRNDQGKSAS